MDKGLQQGARGLKTRESVRNGHLWRGSDAQNSDVVPGGASLRIVAAFSAPPKRERTRISRNSHRNKGKRGRSGPQVPFAGPVKLAIQSPSSVPKSLGGDLCVPELQHPGPLESLNSPVLQVCQCERSTANKIDVRGKLRCLVVRRILYRYLKLRPLHLNIRIIITAFPSFQSCRHIRSTRYQASHSFTLSIYHHPHPLRRPTSNLNLI